MPPTVSAINPSQGPTTGGTAVTLTGTGLSGATAVRFGSTPAVSYTVNSATQITAVAPPGSPGGVLVTVVSPTGTSNAVSYTYTAVVVPALTALTPASGPTTGGTTVTLTGTGLSGATAVRFGSTPAVSYTVNSATQITAVAPPGSPGGVLVTVVSPTGTSNAVSYTYTAVVVPALTALTPASGPTTGGTAVTLTGTGLSGATAVRFGSTPAVSYTVNSATQITAVAPPGSPGGVPVTVTTPGGTSAVSPDAYFFHTAPPALTGATPVLGPTTGGTTVTLTGSDLLGAVAVLFAATPATAFTVVSATQVTATAPPGTGIAQITVTTPGGTSNPVAYTYLAAPTLTALTPTSGPTTAGTVITLRGTGLAAATAVKLGPTPAAFTVVSDTQITATVPAGSAGGTPVTVTTPGGTSNTLTYTRVPPPAI